MIYIPIWIDLKDTEIADEIGKYLIYIPIWIDLKACTSFHFQTLCTYLHSNMDRFERCPLPVAVHRHLTIYIPIWIDLKADDGIAVVLNFPFTFQYG